MNITSRSSLNRALTNALLLFLSFFSGLFLTESVATSTTLPVSMWGSCAWSPDNSKVAVNYFSTKGTPAQREGCLLLLDAKTLERLPASFDTHLSRISWSKDGKFIAGSDSIAKNHGLTTFVVLDAKTMRQIFETPDNMINEFCWAPNDDYIAMASNSGACVWDVQNNRVLCACPIKGRSTSISWSPDGKLVTAMVSEASGKSYITTFSPSDSTKNSQKLVLSESGDWTVYHDRRKVSWSSTGRYLAFADKFVHILEARTMSELVTLPAISIYYYPTLEWSPDGRFLAYQGRDCNIHLFAPETNRHIVLTSSEGEGSLSVFWSPDSKYLAVSDNFGTMAIYNTIDYKLSGSAKKIGFHAWNPDGQSLFVRNLREKDEQEMLALDFCAKNCILKGADLNSPWKSKSKKANRR